MMEIKDILTDEFLAKEHPNYSVEIIEDSIFNRHRVTTMQLKYPRFIHAEFMTHRCLVGKTKLVFDLPSGSTESEYRKYEMTLEDFYDKWVNGSKLRKPSRYVDRDLSCIDPNKVYSAKELAKLVGYKSPSNIRNACRSRNASRHLASINPAKSKAEDYLILGSEFITWASTPKHYRQDISERLSAMKIRAFDLDTQEVIHTTITDVWLVGEKPTFTLKAGNYSITGTSDHPILTKDGWVELGSITKGMSIVAVSNKQNEHVNPNDLKKIDGVWRSTWQRRMSAKLSVEQQGCCSNCGLEKDLEIHHIVPVHVDSSKCFDEDNIVAICNDCHKLEHSTQGWQQGNPLIGSYVLVDSVEATGLTEAVYDLSVADNNHNFVANDIVVHNCFSRNASSSRARPVSKEIERIKDNPAVPLVWGKNQSGMQANTICIEQVVDQGLVKWLKSRDETVGVAKSMLDLGIHKQTVNRLLEPYQLMEVVVTATEWENFFKLRIHEDAQPEIHKLAFMMKQALDNSIPVEREFHLPYVSEEERNEHNEVTLMNISTARCARVSYKLFDGSNATVDKDLELSNKLLDREFPHASPAEHACMFKSDPSGEVMFNYKNLKGWQSYREFLGI